MALSVVLGENGAVAKVGDKEYKLSPLTLNDIADAEEFFGCDMQGFEAAFKKVKNLLFLVYLAVRKNHPEIKPETVGNLFMASDMAHLNDILQAVLNLSGMVSEKKV